MKKRKPVKKADKSKEKPEGITYTESFAAVIKPTGTGRNELVVKTPRWYHHQLNKFKPGTEVTLLIHSRRPKRSEQQNRYYWGVYLPLIAKETGEAELDRLHEYFKGKFLTQGIVEVLGEKVRMKKSSTELGIGEFSQFIMDIETLTGVAAPPTENYGLTALAEGVRYGKDIDYPEENLKPLF